MQIPINPRPTRVNLRTELFYDHIAENRAVDQGQCRRGEHFYRTLQVDACYIF